MSQLNFGGIGSAVQGPGYTGAPGTSSSYSQSNTGVIPGLQANYQNLLNLNQQNYGQVLSAYQNTGQQLQGNLQGIYPGYSGVLGNVENTLGLGAALGQNGNWGVAQPAATAIQQAYQQQQGATTQGLINSGLGNSTVLGNIQNQNTLGYSQAIGGLGAQLAQTSAGYQAQLGLAGLGSQLTGAQLQSSLGQALGGTLGAYRFANTAGNLTGGTSTSASGQKALGAGATGLGGGLRGGGGALGGGAGGILRPFQGEGNAPANPQYYNPTPDPLAGVTGTTYNTPQTVGAAAPSSGLDYFPMPGPGGTVEAPMDLPAGEDLGANYIDPSDWS